MGATSSGDICGEPPLRRPIGLGAARPAIRVKAPGAMRLTLMPWAAPAVARLRVSPITAALGRGVREVRRAGRTAPRGGHDDAAVALVDHVRPGGPGGVERADHVDGQVAGQVVGVGLGEAGPSDDAGVVDQDVEAPELLDGRVDERPCRPRRWPRRWLSATAAPPAATIAAATPDGHAGVRPVAVHRPAQVVDHHAGAPVGQQLGVGPTDAPSGAGDHRHPSLEAVARSPPTRLSLPLGQGSMPNVVGAVGTGAR